MCIIGIWSRKWILTSLFWNYFLGLYLDYCGIVGLGIKNKQPVFAMGKLTKLVGQKGIPWIDESVWKRWWNDIDINKPVWIWPMNYEIPVIYVGKGWQRWIFILPLGWFLFSSPAPPKKSNLSRPTAKISMQCRGASKCELTGKTPFASIFKAYLVL